MIDALTKFVDAPARALIALIFIVSGVGKIGTYAATQGYMEAMGLPGIFLAPTIVFEIGAGLALLAGFQTRLVALALAGFTVVTALVFHFDSGDQIQQIMFLKNLAMAGGLLIVAKEGAQGLSIDAVLSERT